VLKVPLNPNQSVSSNRISLFHIGQVIGCEGRLHISETLGAHFASEAGLLRCASRALLSHVEE